MPLFGPVAVPIVIGLIKELLGWRRRRKARQATEAEQTGVQVDAALGGNASGPLTSEEEVPVAVAQVPQVASRESPPTRALRSRKKIIE
jgi:phosphatidylinositol glycan class S